MFFEKKNIDLKIIDQLKVTKRNYTGKGEFIDIEHPPIEELSGEQKNVRDVTKDGLYFQIGDDIFSCLFWVKDKKIDFMEIFCNGDGEYPNNARDYKILSD